MIRFSRLCASVVLAVASFATNASDWPSQSVKIVLPYPPGGASDVTARLIGAHLSQVWKQPVVVENRPGGNGAIANVAVAKAPGDGYTILMANLGPNSINHAVYPKLPYDTVKDFQPIVLTTLVPLVIVSSGDSPFQSLRELVERAKRPNTNLTFGSAGNGSGSHLAGELLFGAARAPMLHVPYKGDAPAISDVMGGQIAAALPTALAATPHVQSGRLRALAVTSKTRLPTMPDVPTVEEALGLAGFEAVSWGGFLAPAGTPGHIIAKFNSEVNKALRAPEITEKLRAQGAQIAGGSPDAFGAFIQAEIAKWKAVAVQAKIKLE
jgi:tripartite-type tricarboxylate transporter receptor subunit TctC